MLDLPLPNMFEQLLGKDEDNWPPEASLLVAAFRGNVRRLKEELFRRWIWPALSEIARDLDGYGRGIEATVASTRYHGINALHAAGGLGAGKLCVYRYLLDVVKMDVNEPDTTTSKRTPLEHAVEGGNLPAVRFLLDHGADLHQEREHDTSILHTAATKGRSEIVRLLLSRGADVDGSSEELGTPLHFAALQGHESTLEVLLEHHADPSKIVASCLATPLDAAIFASSSSCVKLLIQAGADVNDINNPVARAAHQGLNEAVKWLLEAGANPNRPDEYGRLPIELAAVYGSREDVELLFPLTSPIPTVANWSVDGIINHAKLESMELEDDDVVDMRKSDLKQQGDEAFEQQDFANASVFYTQVLKVDPYDAKMFAKRSLCWLCLGDGQKALEDATRGVNRRSKCAEAHLRQGEALMFLKEYEKACKVLSRGLELDPENDEMDKLFWEAMELKQK